LLSGSLLFSILIVATLHLAKRYGRTVKKVSGFGFSIEFADPEEPGANHN
jgi:hypothetical protein